MPDDNSCMFTAFGGVLGIKDPAQSLREQVAQHILRNPEKYDKVTLENLEPDVYAERIRDPQRWGGQIELAVCSSCLPLSRLTY
jgi:ubiquitin thioesterase OTU1